MSKKPAKKAPASASFSKKEIAALDAAKAHSEAHTPQAILEAFFPEPITIEGLALRPVSLGDFILLEKIESPLIDEEDAREREPTIEDFAAAVFLLSVPFDNVAELWRSGRSEFDRAVLAFAGRVPGQALLTLGLKIKTLIAAGFATVQPMTAGAGEKKTSAPIPASAGG